MESHPPPPPFSTPITAVIAPLPLPPQLQPQPQLQLQPQPAPPQPQSNIPPTDSSCKELSNGVIATTTTATAATTTITVTTATPKLRLMCSYGGHIVPRPYDKSLSYVGGDTRILVFDRHISLSELQFRLSKELLNGNLFILKYRLPSEDLDSLISVATEEDLEHMVEEYDRLLACYDPNSKASRIRLFLFTPNFDPEYSPSIASFLGGNKIHEWFFTALNWNSSSINELSLRKRPSVNYLLGLEDSAHISPEKPAKTLTVANGRVKTGGKAGNSTQDIQSVAESPKSSFGSSTSGASMPVQVDERGVTANPKGAVVVEEQFQKVNVVRKEEEPKFEQQQGGPHSQHVKPPGGSDLPSPESVTSDIKVQAQHGKSPVGSDQSSPESVTSDMKVQGQHVKPPGGSDLSSPESVTSDNKVQAQHVKSPVGSDLSSPESVTSDLNVQNPLSRQTSVVHEEHTASYVQSENGKSFGSHISTRSEDSTRMQMQQVPESGYVYPSHFDHHQYQQVNQPHPHQFVPAQAQYIHNHQQPVYYSVYPPPQQPHYRPGTEHQYPVYYMPPHPQMPPPASASNPDLPGGGVYRMPAAPPALQPVQVPTTQPAPENGGFSRIYLPPQGAQAMNPPGAVEYAYKYVDPANGHVYYSQQPPPPPHVATQYQTVAPSPAAATLSEVPPPRLSTEKH